MVHFSEETVLNLAPDLISRDRARQCAGPWRWQLIEGTDRLIWGEFRTPSEPFLAAVDLQGPGFKCTCPSRKFPCKHALGLLLLLVQQPEHFRVGHTIPEPLKKWIRKRSERREQEPAALKKQGSTSGLHWGSQVSEARLADMRSGISDLRNWLEDIARHGLASTSEQDREAWDAVAARMVDAKLGAIGRRIRSLADKRSAVDWPEQAVLEIGNLQLLVRGFEKFDQLQTEQQWDLLTLAGVNLKKEVLLAEEGLSDEWSVLGLENGEEENLRWRRTWLYGRKNKRSALLLDFAFGNTPFDTNWTAGSSFEGTLCFYPSAYPLRALVQSQDGLPKSFSPPPGFTTITEAMGAFAKAASQQPWLFHIPLSLDGVRPYSDPDVGPAVADTNGYSMALETTESNFSKLMAFSGGHPVRLFGSWNGSRLSLLGMGSGQEWYGLTLTV